MKIKSLKPLWIVLIVAVSLVLLAVVAGVLNGTVGGGEWQIGLQTYRYESTEPSLGGGTVASDITALDVDWIRGDVEIIVSSDDRFPSVSERASDGEAISSNATLRWWVEDGRLVIKCRASGNYLPTSMPEKKLTVRIPASMMADLASLRVASGKGSVSLTVPEEMGFSLIHESTGGRLVSQIPLVTSNGVTLYGDGSTEIYVRTKKGDLFLQSE